MEAADRRQYVKRYYTGAVLSGGFRTSPAGPEDKAGWYHGIYHFLSYADTNCKQGHNRDNTDHNSKYG